MAIGFSPKHLIELPLDDLTAEQFLVLALETAKKLNWNIGTTTKDGFVAYTKFSMSSWSEEVEILIQGETARLKSSCTGNQFIDWGKNKKNLQHFTATFHELKSGYSTEALAQNFEAAQKSFIPAEEAGLDRGPLSTKEKISDFFSLFIPKEGYFVTPILININIFIFLLMAVSGVHIFSPDSESLVLWGANFRPVTLEGEWWRLISCCFLHIGILHLLMNMYALLYIGILLEPYLGRTKFALAYLLTGICASVASLWWHELTISAGASGAIFGMYGVFLAMLTTNLIEKSARQAFITSIAVFVGYNLLNGMKAGIDNAAHIGGLLSGFIIGYAFYPSLRKPSVPQLQISTIAMLSVITISAAFFVYRSIPNDIGEYDKKMATFIEMESKALEVFKMGDETPKEQVLYALQDKGIYYWKENIKILEEADRFELPEELHQKNKKLIDYCNLRIKSYELFYKTVEEDTDQYQSEIESYNTQIESIIKELTGAVK